VEPPGTTFVILLKHETSVEERGTEKLNLESILAGPSDTELNQYRILQALKERREQFSHNRLYPWLAELLQLAGDMQNLQQRRDGMIQQLPQRLREVDMENMNLVYEPAGSETPEFLKIMDLVAWVLPRVLEAVEEGTGIYDFVDQHLRIDEVGIVPAYREEGYWFVQDPRGALVHLLRYEISIFTASQERFRSLKTTGLGTVEGGTVRRSPQSLKLELMRKYADLPNPATYTCDVDIDFPFAETLLPVAKRKFMAHLASQGVS
jgi:hypothetical protein